MSKNFEEEYRQLMTDEVPDLWDRIEANLTEKSLAADEHLPEGTPSFVELSEKSEIVSDGQLSETASSVSIVRGRRNNKADRFASRKALQLTLTAAGIVLLILASGSAIRGRSKAENTSQDAMYASDVASEMEEMEIADAAAEDEELNGYSMTEEADMEMASAETAVQAEESADAAADSIAYEESAEETADSIAFDEDMMESDPWYSDEMKGVRKADGSSQMNSGQVVESDGNDAANVSNEAKGNTNGTDTMTGIYHHLTIEITEIENTGEEIIYYATVLGSKEGEFDEGSEVSFCIGDSLIETEPEYGRTYTVVLEDTTPELSNLHPYILREIVE